MRQNAYSGPLIVTDGIVACWDAAGRRSYPGAGTAWTSPVNNVVGTLFNTPIFNPNNGGYFEFDGSNDYLGVSTSSTGYDAINLTADTVSLFLWVSRAEDDYTPILAKRAGGCPQYELNWYPSWGYTMDGTNARLVFELECGIVASDPLNFIDSWNYIGATFDGTTVRFYTDGQPWGTSSYSNEMVTSTDNLRLASNDGGRYAECDLSLAHIYNRVLTAAEVLQNYNATRGRFGV